MRWVLGVLTLLTVVNAHSWLDCTNWIPNNPNNPGFSPSQGRCAGWARRYDAPPDKGFGQHDTIQFFRHYEQQTPTVNRFTEPCRNQPSNAAGGSHEIRGNPPEAAYAPNRNYYGRSFQPMASVQAGQTICWTWPAKNHFAHVFINNDIEVNWSNRPDYEPANQAEWTNMKIHTANYKDCPTPFDILPGNDQTGVGSDRRACGTCFRVPANLASGTYAVQWRWKGIDFATKKDFAYTSCGDIKVTSQANALPPPPPVQENLAFVTSPNTYDITTTATLRMRYSTPAARELVIDLLKDVTYQWYGRTTVTVQAGSGEINLNLKPLINPPNGQGYIFSSFLVPVDRFRANPGEAWRSATSWARAANTVITGSNVPVSANNEIQEKITFMQGGVPSRIATTATSIDIGITLTSRENRIMTITVLSYDMKTTYASIKVPVTTGTSSQFVVPLPFTRALPAPTPVTYDNTSTPMTSDAPVLTVQLDLFNANGQIISSDTANIMNIDDTTTVYPIPDKIAFVTNNNGGMYTLWKAGASVDITLSYAASSSRTIWLRLLDSSSNTTMIVKESSHPILGGRGSIRISWVIPSTLTIGSSYDFQALLLDSNLYQTSKDNLEPDMGIATTVTITIGNNMQITQLINTNTTIIESQSNAPTIYQDVIKPGQNNINAASTSTIGMTLILMIALIASMEWY